MVSAAGVPSNAWCGSAPVFYGRFRAFGWDSQLVRLLQEGTIAALVVQDPFRMGYEGVKIALAASKGDQVPPSVDTGATAITKANMNSARSQELLNPKIK